MKTTKDNPSVTSQSGKRHPVRQKLLSSLLCVCLLLVSLPMEFYGFEVQAEEPCRQILSFSDLPQEIMHQAPEPGTPLENLNLPKALEAVCIPLENEPAVWPETGFEMQKTVREQEISEPPEQATDASTNLEETVMIENITWTSAPSYEPETEGVYIFIPVLPEQYVPAEGLPLPEIQVTVKNVEDSEEKEESREPAAQGKKAKSETGEEPEYSEEMEDYNRESGDLESLISPASDEIVISQDTLWASDTLNKNLVIEEGATLTLNGILTVSGNVTIRGQGTIARGNTGAGIEVNRSASLTMQEITLNGKGLEAAYAMIRVSGALKMEKGCTIQDCHTRGPSEPGSIKGYGGAVYLFWNRGARADLLDCVILNCTASEGGAAYCSKDCTLTLDKGCRIENCRAVKGVGYGTGGAVEAYGDTGAVAGTKVNLLNCTISGCSAEADGGAIRFGCATLTLGQGCRIENCRAADEGGAVLLSERSNADFQGCTISDCFAGRVGGGVCCTNSSTLKINEGCKIQNCSAADCGGAVSLHDHTTADFRNCTISDCSAKRVGGGVYCTTSSTLEINEGCKIQNCSAENGGAIFNEWSELYINGGEFSGNIATTAGGAIDHGYWGGTAATYLSGGIFQGNSCTSENYKGSGGIFLFSPPATSYEPYVEISGAVKFIGDGTESGLDCIYLDSKNERPQKIIVSKPLSEPVTVYLEGEEHYVIAKGTESCSLTEEDRKKISFVDVGESGKRWRLELDETENEIYLTEWECKTLFAEFYSGGPEPSEPVPMGTDVDKTAAEGTIPAPSLRDFPGWEPMGWSESPSEYVPGIGTDGTCILTEEVREYYGIYRKPVTLTYNANGGSDAPAPETKEGYANVHREVALEFPEFTFAPAICREGYTFAGWNTAPDGTGTSYEAGATERLEQDTLLYAVWQGVPVVPEPSGPSGPKTAPYRVEHYCQSLTGEEYLRMDADTERLTGDVGAEVKAQPKTYTGFTLNLSHPSEKAEGTVEADGSLALKLYYDRLVYEVDFNLNGGYGKAPDTQHIRYGGLLAQVEDPVRRGYNFKGWYLDEKGMEAGIWDFESPVEQNTGKLHTTLYAKWADELAPEAGEAVFSKGHQNFRDWLMQKESMVITVSVTEEGSGLAEAKYLLVSEEGTEREGQAAFAEIHPLSGTMASYGSSAALLRGVQEQAEQGKYEVRFAIEEEFKGKVYLTCTDYAGNVSAQKTLTAEGGGVIVEDNAPEIRFSNTKETASGKPLEVKVSVQDDMEGHVTGGISGIRYVVDNGKETSLPKEDFAEDFVEEYGFTVKIRGEGKHTLRVEAADHAGNESAAEITLKINGVKDIPTETPDTPSPDVPEKPNRPLGGEPKTGDGTQIQICATLSMIAGFGYLLLYFEGENGITEEEKEEILSRLVSWAKQGGSIRKLLGLALIFLFLAYYHSIGKSVSTEWKEVYGK